MLLARIFGRRDSRIGRHAGRTRALAPGINDAVWRPPTDAITSGMPTWRRQHPNATVRAITTALDARLPRGPARMRDDRARRIRDFAPAAGEVDALAPTAGGDRPLRAAHRRRPLRHDRPPAVPATGGSMGPGSVASANPLVVAARCKGPRRPGAAGTVQPLRAQRHAIGRDRWGAVWAAIAAQHRQPERRRRLARHRHRRAPGSRAAPQTAARDPIYPPAARAGGGQAGRPVRPDRPAAARGYPAADHPWRNAGRIRRPRAVAATA